MPQISLRLYGPALALLAALPLPAIALQTASEPPHYDVVSVHEAKPPYNAACDVPDGPDMTTLCGSLQEMIANAYRVPVGYVLGIPKWATDTGYTLRAKVPDSDVSAMRKLSWRDRGPLMQPVLADRFGLKVHHETRIVPGYVLLTGKGGPKLKPHVIPQGSNELPGAHESLGISENVIQGKAVSMSTLTRVLSGQLGQPVLDKTGVQGSFDFEIEARMQDAAPGGGPLAPSAANNRSSDVQHLFSAVRDQLGLVLKAEKVPVEYIVVEEAHPPALD